MIQDNSNSAQNQAPKPAAESHSGGVISKSLLSIVLIFIESALTLMLRFDPKLRQLAYPLAKAGTVVCIRSYLPHVTVYATFGYRGVLLDNELPQDKQAADITINAYSFQLINALINHNPDHIEALQIRGEAAQVENLKGFLVRVGVGGAIQNVLAKFTGGDKQKPTPEERAEKIANYQIKINEQAERIDTLTMENQRLATQLIEAKSKQKSAIIAAIVAAFIALVGIVLHFVI